MKIARSLPRIMSLVNQVGNRKLTLCTFTSPKTGEIETDRVNTMQEERFNDLVLSLLMAEGSRECFYIDFANSIKEFQDARDKGEIIGLGENDEANMMNEAHKSTEFVEMQTNQAKLLGYVVNDDYFNRSQLLTDVDAVLPGQVIIGKGKYGHEVIVVPQENNANPINLSDARIVATIK